LIGAAPLGNLADMAVNLLVRHSFSKSQEAEADDYSFALLVNSEYDPNAASNAFASLLSFHARQGATPAPGVNPIRDYFMSHPPLELREARYREEARIWWGLHSGEARYVGRTNLRERRSIKADPRSSEWTSGADE